MSGANAIALCGIYRGKYRLFDAKPPFEHSPLKATQKYPEVDGIGSLDGPRDFKYYGRRS